MAAVLKYPANKYMRLAFDLAKKAEGRTFPNPLVGAVIVRGARIVGSGFHKVAGSAHAEIVALKEAGGRAKGAVLFCTFEPCSHFGRTGPCVDEIVKAGIKEVYIGMVDPNPLIRGTSIEKLRLSGVKVHVGFLEKEIATLNRPFIKSMTEGLPLVTIKIAESLDGKIATKNGESKWITSEQARHYSHGQRVFFDAIMAGVRTVISDDPGLEPDKKSPTHKLTKLIIDSELKIPLSARLFKTRQRVIIAAVEPNKAKERLLLKRGVEVIYTKSKNGRVDLKDFLRKLNKFEIRSVLVEGGSSLISSLLDERLADRIMVYIAPKIIGGAKALSCVGGDGAGRLSEAINMANMDLKMIGQDILIEGDLIYS